MELFDLIRVGLVLAVVYVIFILRDPFSGTLGLPATPYLALAG